MSIQPSNQTRLGSFFEALLAALAAAPTAQGLHWMLLELWGNEFTDPGTKLLFLEISWISFFIHSIVWKYILRRLFVKYGFKLEPSIIATRIRGLMR